MCKSLTEEKSGSNSTEVNRSLANHTTRDIKSISSDCRSLEWQQERLRAWRMSREGARVALTKNWTQTQLKKVCYLRNRIETEIELKATLVPVRWKTVEKSYKTIEFTHEEWVVVLLTVPIAEISSGTRRILKITKTPDRLSKQRKTMLVRTYATLYLAGNDKIRR